MITRCKSNLTFLVMLFAITSHGCAAVLTIDVDVYKGPLANHPDVQTEQMAAMAIGAKPLLRKLCEALRQEKTTISGASADAFCDGKPPSDASRDSKSIPTEIKQIEEILSLYRDTANAAVAARLASIEDAIRAYTASFNLVTYVPRSNQTKADAKRWQEIEAGMYKEFPPDHPALATYRSEVQRLGGAPTPEKQKEAESKIQQNLGQLRAAYELFLTGCTDDGAVYRNIDNIYIVHYLLHKDLKSFLGDLDPEKILDAPYRIDFDDPSKRIEFESHCKRNPSLDDPTSANAEFSFLAEGRMLKRHAELLFPPTARKERQLFINRAVEISDAFATARKQLDKLLRAALGLISDLPTSELPASINKEEARRVAAELVAELVRPKYLWYALENAAVPAQLDEFKEFRKALKPDATNVDFLLTVRNRKDHAFHHPLLRLLQEDTFGIQARRLLAAHTALIESYSPLDLQTLEKKADCEGTTAEALRFKDLSKERGTKICKDVIIDKKKWTERPQRLYGLTAGPELPPPVLGNDLKERLRELREPLGGAFERGRLLYGLETLIERYLQAHYDQVLLPTDNSDNEISQRRVLEDALVGFAEKVLFVANKTILIQENKDPDTSKDSHTRRETRTFARVLQSVGNSILVQADELRHRQTYLSRIQEQTASELAAIQYSSRLDPGTRFDQYVILLSKAVGSDKEVALVIMDHRQGTLEQYANGPLRQPVGVAIKFALIAELEKTLAVPTDSAKKAALEKAIELVKRTEPAQELPPSPLEKVSNPGFKTALEALDAEIALLRHEHIRAVKEGGEQAGKELLQALRRAYEARSNMVFVRPSGAYLRSSYPATALQDDPGLGWRNMLEDQVLRSIPFIGPWLVKPCKWQCNEDLDLARVTADIDKQFWQSINRVRVTGGGITNYVIAKDDIGNWYVKTMAANPEPIINSARNLALFGLGGGATTGVLQGVKTASTADSASPQDSEDTVLAKVVDKHRGQYDVVTESDLKDLQTELDHVVNRIDTAWSNSTTIQAEDLERLKKALTQAKETLSREQTELGKDDAKKDRAFRILHGLGALRRFHNELLGSVRSFRLPTDQEAGALQSIRDITGGILEEFLGRRKRTTRDYESALNLAVEVLRER